MRQTGKSLFPWVKETDISKEIFRTYVWESGATVTIKNPRTLVVSDNGHRVVDGNFIAHYIPYGWIHLFWENTDKEQYQFRYQRPEAKSD